MGIANRPLQSLYYMNNKKKLFNKLFLANNEDFDLDKWQERIKLLE